MSKEKINEEIKKTSNLLKIEKDEDLFQYKQKMLSTSLIDRRNEGVCWYPVKLEKTSFDFGERLLVKVSRNKEHTQSHLFQSGKLISLFSNSQNNTEEETSISGVVNQVKDYEMIITINADDFPDWIHDGKLGVQLLFDDNSYNEMEKALDYLINTKEERITHLKNIILGNIEAEFSDEYKITIPELNESQNDALNLVLNALDIAIIHGPPGTGKTTTLIQAIKQVLKFEKQVLVCAPSNAAVDLLVEKLTDIGIEVVRIGHPARITEKVLHNTLDFRITRHNNYKDLKMVKKEEIECVKAAKKYKRNYGEAERTERRELFAAAKKLREEAQQLSFYITNNVLTSAQVIASTMIGANNLHIRGFKFDTVFIDEAAQGLEPATWIPILKSKKVVFAGDHCQLPPTIKSINAAKNGLEITLFEKAIKNNNADTMLKEQYRMNNDIMEFSSRFFYDNKLISNDLVKNHKIYLDDTAIEFIDTAGLGYNETVDSETKSTYNKEEVTLLFKHFINYLKTVEEQGLISTIQDIGIISPYKAQVTFLREYFENTLELPVFLKNIININTVDSFQGQERDIIYISLVRSNENAEIGFLNDIRRMNVAMTRAKKKLVVLGDSATICQNKFYDKFVDYVNEIGAYKSGYEILYT
jgi:superfamily I DNA and/or RNA helicase